MLRRLFVGLLLGSVIGAALAAAFVGWLKVTAFHGALATVEAYGAALVVGVVAGLVTGKPVWASGAKVEASLKALFGALLAAGGMFALRHWAPVVDLRALGVGGPAAPGDLPVLSLPVIGAALGALFELDNTNDGETPGQAPARPRVASSRGMSGARPLMADPEEASSVPESTSKRAKR
jgi:hypothetical protein